MPKTKTKTLTRAEVKRIEARRSSYGCGVLECMACYPLEYSCEYCAVDFEIPIHNGEAYVCEACGWDRLTDLP
jgi:hypothetical protein